MKRMIDCDDGNDDDDDNDITINQTNHKQLMK